MSTAPGKTNLPAPRPSGDVTSCDSPLIFMVKALLYPVTTVAFLGLCLLIWRQPLTGPYFLVAVIGFAGTGELLDLSKLGYLRPSASAGLALRYIATRWYALGLCILLLLHLSRVQIGMHDPPLLTWLLLMPWVLWGMHLAVWSFLFRIGVKHMPLRSAVIVGLTEQGLQLKQMFAANPLLRIRCLGFFEDRAPERTEMQRLGTPANSAPDIMEATPLLGKTADVFDFVRQHNVQLVYITLPLSRDPRVLTLLEALHDSVASIYFVPDVFAMSLIEARVEVVNGIPLIAVCESPFYGVRGLVKRCSDIVIASLILLVIAPVLLGVAIGVKLSSPGPVIFKQRRYGLDGREIMVYKFRSMTVTEDGDRQYRQVTRNDSRVTLFGAFIRRTSLDELPQFLNVLNGSMSVVGPRPHAVAVNEHYRAQIPSYMMRHKIKPGITGWAQVNGYRGGDDLHSMTKRIEFDLRYLANWSLWLDLKIIGRTIAVVLRDRHAF